MKRSVRKAVFPVAGLGTRFLPATKASPKEMLPVVDKPVIQYAVEEAVEAGVDTIIFITGRTKRAITDHFDKAYELEAELEARGKDELLRQVRSTVPKGVNCVYIRQGETLGLGHAVLCARPVVGDEPFAVLLADDLLDGRGEPGVVAQMAQQLRKYQCSIIGVEQVPPEDISRYGVIEGLPFANGMFNLNGIVEKPQRDEAPSDLGVVGRYILTPRIFEVLDKTPPGAGGEIQLTDAIATLLHEEQILAYQFHGKRYDCGNKLGYLSAVVEHAMKHPELGDEFTAYLRDLVGPQGT